MKKKKKNKQNVCFYILSKEKKEILIEICITFINRINMYESLYIENFEFNDDNTLDDFFMKYDEKRHILIVEIIDENCLNFLVQLNNENALCSVCNKQIVNINKKFNCDICHFSLFCSRKCSFSSEEHLTLDKNLNKIMEPKFTLDDLISLELDSLLSRDCNIGRVILKNIGNISFMNSVLQCLSNTPDLNKYFLKQYFRNEINNGNYYGSKGLLSQAYFNLVNQLWNKRGDNEINPREFRNIFCNLNKSFINQDQEHDAYEFLTFLLDNLHEDLNRISNKKYQILEEKKEDENDEQASNRWWEYYKNRDNSIITDLFQGQYKTTIKCLCGNTSIKYDTYMNLSLPIPSKRSYIPIKLFTNNGNYIDLNIKANEKTELKDVILKSTKYLDKSKYFEYIKQTNSTNNLFNYNISESPINILYNNIQVIELSKEHKILNIYDSSYDNIINKIDNNKNQNVNYIDNFKFIKLSESKDNSEFILLEKDINSNLPDYIDVYLYPVAEIEKEGYISFTKVFKILAYPTIFSANKNDNLKTLKIQIFQKFQKILQKPYRGYLNAIEICYPHFNDKWGINKMKECPFCKKSYDRNTKYCSPFDSINSKIKILDLIKNLNCISNNKNIKIPLIFYVKSNYYDPESRLYRGMNLFYDKKNEIESKANLSLYDSLELFSQEELLEGENMWYCKKCKSKKKAKKKIELYRTPYYLIIQLKRFKQKNNSSLGNKNDTFIEYKEVLDLNDFIASQDKNRTIYNLYGVVIHKKFINTNTFLSYCKNFSYWLSYDNTSLNIVENPISKDAYLLFYKRRNID